MKRARRDKHRDDNAKKAYPREQFALDREGKRLFHGAFEGGNVKEANDYQEDTYEGSSAISKMRNDKKQDVKFLGINDIIDQNDGTDFLKKELEIEKLMKNERMSYTEAERFIEEIGWDGTEEIFVKRRKGTSSDYEVTFGRQSQNQAPLSQSEETIKIDFASGKETIEQIVAKNEKEIKTRFSELKIKHEFEDTKVQKRYEDYLTLLAANKNPTKYTLKNRHEFSGVAIGSILSSKNEKSTSWLDKFIEKQEKSKTVGEPPKSGDSHTVSHFVVTDIVRKRFML
ncbi:hypothetical protein EIN_172790 [Entamoeba invadens IP1]|uniref:G patch domain-containing protein n=1 Tax=Entamoeba invadens IP1 TaxID=370355 RepID=A0A0A1TVV0_ENTIV|nr:hypothetical protein EIN_172790 [Entamoeba invadens IP1]ELP84634.1 hypothetical protein EIN_172790 [Entamoeba invadens IP1]|eukprot:XP_004183980.1 hypothetical protein EIN_172790 [Entamoeba invadens IP1]